MHDCPSETELQTYAHGGASPELTDKVEDHIFDCWCCCMYVAQHEAPLDDLVDPGRPKSDARV